jgi:uncharacterized iron-regulated membrane protein
VTGVWIGLAFVLLVVTTGTVYVIRRTFALYRDVRTLLSGGVAALTELSRRAEIVAENAAAKAERGEAVAESLDRLRRSQARLEVELAAVRRVSEQFSTLTVFLPRK